MLWRLETSNADANQRIMNEPGALMLWVRVCIYVYGMDGCGWLGVGMVESLTPSRDPEPDPGPERGLAQFPDHEDHSIQESYTIAPCRSCHKERGQEAVGLLARS